MSNPSCHRVGGRRGPAAVVEVVGLSGVGKTAACRVLLARNNGAKQSWISIPGLKIRRSFLPRLLLPITLIRYRRVFRAQCTPDAGPWQRTRAVLLLCVRRAARLWRAENPLVSTMFLLTTSVTELELARLEARLRRRPLIVDEGFVHRALGVWIRSDPARRDEVLAAYLDTIPVASACILLRCDPVTAHARALTRERGVPLVTRRAAEALDTGDADDDAMSAIYREHAGVFDLESLRARVRILEVDATGTPEGIAEQIEESLRQFGADQRPLIFLRT